MNPRRIAFTLAEVLFALLVLSIGILSILALFPVGIRAQDQVRYQMYASIKAMELSDALAQHTKNFSDRVHEMTGPLSGSNIVAGGVYGSLARFDAENVWAAGGQNGVYPVPVEIARRLDSPGNEIQRVLDQGSYLFYHDPRPVRGFSMTEANNPSSAKTAPELQRLVFAVVGAPQQNALPQHPCLQGPVYLLYPFAPQALRLQRSMPAKVGTSIYPSHKYVWDPGNIKAEWNSHLWEGVNWEILASTRFVDSPWRDGILAFRNLCYFGWAPIEYKFNGLESNGADPLPSDGFDLKEDEKNGDVWTRHTIAKFSDSGYGVSITNQGGGVSAGDVPNYWSNGDASGWRNDLSTPPPNPNYAGAGYARGYLNTVYDESPGTSRLTVMDAFLDPGDGSSPMSFETFVKTPGLTGLLPDASRFDKLVTDVIGSGISNPTGIRTEPDPTNWIYRELGSIADQRLPSLQQRYLYRWLALKLWRDVTVNSPLAGTNPLVENIWLPDGTSPDAASLHAARVFALSHLADAAVRVGGMRLPLVLPGGVDEDINKLVDKAGITNEGATDAGSAFPGSTTDEAGPRQATSTGTPNDVSMGKVAHENALRWAIAYANRFPHDNLVPRPANRQVMMDRAIWQWDLFDAAGRALRNNTPNTWQGAAMNDTMPGYKVLPRPGIAPNASEWNATGRSVPLPRLAPGMQISGGPHRYGGKALTDAQARWFERMAGATEPTFDVQSSARAGRYHMNLSFSPQDRMRQIVYWAVDWKGYEDSESAPSAPHGAEQMARSFLPDDYWGTAPTNAQWNDFDPSESPLIWFGRDRTATFATRYGPDSNIMFGRRGGGNTMSWSKQLGSIIDQFDIEGINHTYGMFGADRDGNGVHTIGSIKASTRLRAIEVARFNYYDPVVWSHVRK